MRISEEGTKFIASWEAFKPKAYKDLGGVWTIGYGTIKYAYDGSRVKKGDKTTKESALFELSFECNYICHFLRRVIKPYIPQHQVDAIVSLTYNIGQNGFKSSTLLRKINEEKPIVEDYFTRWNKITVDGKLVPVRGLTRRRRSEFELFFYADYKGNL